MARICIVIGAHLATAPRPQKEADALAAAGHDVRVLGVWFDPVLAARDEALMQGRAWRFTPVLDFRPARRLQNLAARLENSLARRCYRSTGCFSPASLGYGARAMLAATRAHPADLTIAHSEVGLWVACRLLEEGRRVGVDFEDWYATALSPDDRANRPIERLAIFEERLATAASYVLAPSRALAAALAERYRAPMPTVVYNTFPWADRARLDGRRVDRLDDDLPSIHWFSQTIGPDRGLEMLFEALPRMAVPASVHVRGACPQNRQAWLERLIPDALRARIHVHGTVPNDELASRIAEHDVGLALERPDLPSRDLSVTNKLFQYLVGGLAVVATPTRGQREVLQACPEAGRLVPYGDAAGLAAALDELLGTPRALSAAREAALGAARDTWSWEHDAPRLVAAAARALSS